MVKSKKTVLGAILCTLMALFIALGIFMVESSPKTAYASGVEHDHGTWTAWGDDDGEKTSLPTDGGSYVLVSDITLTEIWNVPGSPEVPAETNLCLNGRTINANGGDFTVINVVSGATLNLYDCGNEKYYFDKDSGTGLWSLAEDQGVSTDYSVIGGVITGGIGGVYVSGEFNMFNGNIVGNSSSGIDINTSGTFNLYGGSVVGNATTGNGGGINNNGTFTMTGGTIAYNKANNGGGLYTSPLAVNILTGGSITGNTAISGGGVFYKAELCFAAGTPITMADGSRKAIETLQIGDLVRVFDHENGEISSSNIYDVWKYPEKHSDLVRLHFSNNVDVNVVYGHSFFEREQNKYVSVTKDNVKTFLGHEFYNVDDGRWETLEGYEFIDGKVDTYVITSEYQLNCVANGMLTNEDGFYTVMTNVFEFGDNLKIDASKKASDIAQYGLYEFENLKYMSKETYDKLNFQYLNVAFNKGLITPEEFAYLEAYWANVDPSLYCEEDEKTSPKSEPVLLSSPFKVSLLTSVPAPTTPGIYVGGSVKITGNTPTNMYLTGGKTLTLGTGTNGVAVPTQNMSIGITLEDKIGSFTANGTADDLSHFFSDNEDLKVCFNKGTSAVGDECLGLKMLVDFDEEYSFNFGTPIVFGDNYTEIAPKVYFGEEEITSLTFTYTYYKTTNNGFSWDKMEGKPTDAGSYKVYIEVDDSDYTGIKEYKFNIAKKEITVIWTEKTFTYNGEDQFGEIFVSYKTDLNSEEYTITDRKYYQIKNNKDIIGTSSAVISKDFIEVGEYTANLTTAGWNYVLSTVGSNYKLPASAKRTHVYTILKAPNEITLSINSFIEGGSAIPTATATFGTEDIELTYAIKSATPSFSLTELPTTAGKYILRASVVGSDNYEGATKELEFTVYKTSLKPIENQEIAEITDSVGGIDPEAVLVIKVVELGDNEKAESIRKTLKSGKYLSGGKKIYAIYDAKLLIGETELQPNGNITVKMQVPVELIDKEFKLYRIQNGNEVYEITYSAIDSDGFITFDVDKLSEFAFVSKGDGLGTCAIIAIIILIIIILILILYLLGYFFLYRKGKLDDKKIRVIYKFLPRGDD